MKMMELNVDLYYIKALYSNIKYDKKEDFNCDDLNLKCMWIS